VLSDGARRGWLACLAATLTTWAVVTAALIALAWIEWRSLRPLYPLTDYIFRPAALAAIGVAVLALAVRSIAAVVIVAGPITVIIATEFCLAFRLRRQHRPDRAP
jgi:hypothetical protein